jgi:hypothetical protein
VHLKLYAGPTALRLIRERGLQPDDIDLICGAAGGPKWLVLYGLDEAVLGFLEARSHRPLHLVGASSGAWRMACYAQGDPLSALQRLDEAYTHQCYPPKPSLALVTQTCAAIIHHCLEGGAAAEPRWESQVEAGRSQQASRPLQDSGSTAILSHPYRRLHLLTARCKGPLATDLKPLLLAGLTAAALGNMVSRRLLGHWMERVIYHSADSPLHRLADIPTRHVRLCSSNLHEALLATGSIPLLAEGVSIPPLGCHRDGALIDYHPSFDFGDGAGVVLYPHFAAGLMRGWFDRLAPWRTTETHHLDRVLLAVPSQTFVDRLPRGKISDRNDFYELSDKERIRSWNQVRDASRWLGDDFRRLVASPDLARHCVPIEAL